MNKKDVISSALFATLAFGTIKALDRVSKYKHVNQAVGISGSYLLLNHLKTNNMIPVVGGVDLNKKRVQIKKD